MINSMVRDMRTGQMELHIMGNISTGIKKAKANSNGLMEASMKAIFVAMIYVDMVHITGMTGVVSKESGKITK